MTERPPMGWHPHPRVDHNTHVDSVSSPEPRAVSVRVPCPDRGLCPLTNASVPHEHLTTPDGGHHVEVLEEGYPVVCGGPPVCTLAAAGVEHEHRRGPNGEPVDHVTEALTSGDL